MATRDQNIGCVQGDSFTFAVVLLPYPDGTMPDLTGATASWALQEGNYTGAAVLIDKSAAPGIFVQQNEDGTWQVVVDLDPIDTVSIPRGIYYHQCKVTLAATNVVSHIEGGAFALGFTGIP